MYNTMSKGTGRTPPDQQAAVCADNCRSDKHIVFAIGVVLLVFGPAITGLPSGIDYRVGANRVLSV